VIDTCAGCAQGSRHVDLTKAAFKALADLEIGVTTVKMRRATHPKEWWVVCCVHEPCSHAQHTQAFRLVGTTTPLDRRPTLLIMLLDFCPFVRFVDP